MSFQRPDSKGPSVRQMRDYFTKWCSVSITIGIVFLVLFMFASDLERPFLREMAIIFGIAAVAWALAMVVFFFWYAVDGYARRGQPRPLFPVPDRYQSV